MKIPRIGIQSKFRYLKNTLIKKNNLAKSVKIGANVELINCLAHENVSFAHHSSVKNSSIGKYTSIGRYTKITHADIGSFCAISWDLTINAIQHPINHLTVHAFPYIPQYGLTNSRKDTMGRVKIGHDVWIGANSVIMPGISVGNGAIIAAGAVVTKNVPDYAIVGGVPAKILKYRFDEKIIQELLKIEWWNFDFHVIKQNIHLFNSEFGVPELEKLKQINSKMVI